jgi:hypothetical protein
LRREARERDAERIAEVERRAETGEPFWGLCQDGNGQRYIFPSGPGADKVIESSSYAEPGQAEAAQDEAAPELEITG